MIYLDSTIIPNNFVIYLVLLMVWGWWCLIFSVVLLGLKSMFSLFSSFLLFVLVYLLSYLFPFSYLLSLDWHSFHTFTYAHRSRDEMQAWIAQVGNWDKVKKELDTTINYTKKDGASKFGIFGFCWGGTHVYIWSIGFNIKHCSKGCGRGLQD